MGGLAPGIGGLELVVIALVALLVVGPRDLPLLMRKVGKAMGKARAMANEFRASFDEMARQSELDELRKEVEALRTGQIIPLGDEADKAFKDIRDDLNRPLDAPAPAALAEPQAAPEAPPATAETPVPKKAARKTTGKTTAKTAAKTAPRTAAKAKKAPSRAASKAPAPAKSPSAARKPRKPKS